MTTIYLIRTQRTGYLCDAAYTTESAAAEAASRLPPGLGWWRIVPRPLLSDGEAPPSDPTPPPAAAAPLTLSIAAAGTVTHPTLTHEAH